MDVISIQRHPIKYFFVVGAVLPALFLLGLYFWYLAFHEIFSDGGIVLYFWVLMGILLTVLPGGIWFNSINRSPAVKLEGDRIIFNENEKYPLDQIKKIDLTALLYNRDLNIFGGNDGIIMDFKNGRRIYLYDDQYRDLTALRIALSARLQNKKIPTGKALPITKLPEARDSSPVQWVKVPFPSWRDVFIYFLVFFYALPSLTRWFWENPIVLALIILVVLVDLLYLANRRITKIGISEAHLWIKRLAGKGAISLFISYFSKNQRDVLPLEQIEKAAIVREGYSIRLRLVLKDWSIVNYYLTPLNNERLDRVCSLLMEKNIEVEKRY